MVANDAPKSAAFCGGRRLRQLVVEVDERDVWNAGWRSSAMSLSPIARRRRLKHAQDALDVQDACVLRTFVTMVRTRLM